MGKAIVLVSPELLACALHLPENAKIIAIKDEIDWHRWIELLVESDDIPESDTTIKFVTPTYHRISNVVTDRIEFTWDSDGFVEPEEYIDKIRFRGDGVRFVDGLNGYEYDTPNRDYRFCGVLAGESAIEKFLSGFDAEFLK